MVKSIQFLRAMAALMVVYFHAITMIAKQQTGSIKNTGAAGVDIFFVISGFVIFLVSIKKHNMPIAFFGKRLIRVVPLYWLYTTITVALLLFMPSAYKNLRFKLIHTIYSYFFLLSVNNAGGIGTVLGVGWTLAYEMYFYFIFFISMIIMPSAPFKLVVVIISGGALLSFLNIPVQEFALVPLSTLPLEFLAGCFIANLYTRGFLLKLNLSIIAIATGIFGIWYFGNTGKILSERETLRFFYWGIPAVLIIYGFVSLDANNLIKFHLFFLVIGDASYSIYLSHQFIIAFIANAWISYNLYTIFSSEVLLISLILFSIIFGLLSYYMIERPITIWLNLSFGFGKLKH